LDLGRCDESLESVLAHLIAEERVSELRAADPLLLFLYTAPALESQPDRPFEVLVGNFHRRIWIEPTATDDMLAEGDRVAVRVTWRCVHDRGPLLGVPITGKHIRAWGIAILRVADGRVAERWLEFDALGLMRQLREG
jgi:hypothetical protein